VGQEPAYQETVALHPLDLAETIAAPGVEATV
jgi:hypothetical protein